MFSTGHGAVLGLISGTLGAAIHHGLTLALGAGPGIKGGVFGVMHTYPSERAQTFWAAMATDIRLPIGWLFSALGVILLGYGVMTSGSEMHARSESVNINIWWGLVVLVFGLLLLWLAWRGRQRILRGSVRAATPAEEEARERATGMPPRGA